MNITVDGINIIYPDLGFAFNPIRIIINNYSRNDSIILKSNNIQIEREPYKDTKSLSFELSGISKSLFDRLSFYNVQQVDSTLFKTISFVLQDKTGIIHEGIIPVIWGALQIGEVYSQNKTLSYFKGFPFTVPLYLEDDMFIQYRSDNGPLQNISPFTKGKYNIDVSNINAKNTIEIISSREEKYKIFDYTFDSTFGPQRVLFPNSYLNIKIKVIDCPNEGVYLRWINKYGEYNYYLFTSSNESVTTKNNDIYFDNIYHTTALTNNYHQGTGKSIGKNIEQSDKLFASLIDSDTFDMLMSLVESPVVDMFTGYDSNNKANWISVSIAEGTFTKTTASLQDFELFLTPNKRQIQVL